jgi:hypothetical protein
LNLCSFSCFGTIHASLLFFLSESFVLGTKEIIFLIVSLYFIDVEEHSPRNNHVYSREFQSMLDGLDEEGCVEESGHIAEKKRRLSVEQVKALEKNFEVENKLEPERKVKLAQELGLQPRQVAVWFQNRRARWKTKQLERDYGVLKASYDSLKVNCDTLQHDNEALLKEVHIKSTILYFILNAVKFIMFPVNSIFQLITFVL